jgi:hypothetical protein
MSSDSLRSDPNLLSIVLLVHTAAEGNNSITGKEEKSTILMSYIRRYLIEYWAHLLSILVDDEGGETVHPLGVAQLPKQSLNQVLSIIG